MGQLHPTARSTHVSPAMRLYPHALESIFAMLKLKDLAQILTVSHSWAAAVRSTKPIPATIEREGSNSGPPLPPIEGIVGSPLLRHVAAIDFIDPDLNWPPLNNESLGLLAQHAPNLQSLSCGLRLTPIAPLILPAKLTSLQLQIEGEYSDMAIDGVLTTPPPLPRSFQRTELRFVEPPRSLPIPGRS